MNSFQASGFPFVNADLTRVWSNFKLPSLKIGELLELHRKNASALTNANQAVFDGLTTFAQRQGELLKATVNDCSKVTRDVLTGGSFEERATKQADAARHICVSSVACLQELSDIAMKTNVTAVDILNARVSEALDEFRSLFAASVAPTTVTTLAATSVIAEPVAVVEEIPDADAVAAEPAVVEEVSDADAERSVGAAPTTAPKKAARPAKAAQIGRAHV